MNPKFTKSSCVEFGHIYTSDNYVKEQSKEYTFRFFTEVKI